MYSRSYSQGDIPPLPESYGGVAFREPEPIPEDAPKSIPKSADVKFTTSPAPPDPKLTTTDEPSPEPEAVETGGFLSGIFERLPLKSLFAAGAPLDVSKMRLPRIGTEEILIAGLALFLFFSKDGDKECAVLLLLLLFIR
jgi:hypothetical protein